MLLEESPPISEMGRKRRSGAKKEREEGEEEDKSVNMVVVLSSSDDEEANRDLSLEIVERATLREAKMRRRRRLDGAHLAGYPDPAAGSVDPDPSVIDLSSSDDVEVIPDQYGGGGVAEIVLMTPMEKERGKKDKKKKKKLNKNPMKEEQNEEEQKVSDGDLKEEEPVGTNDSVVTEVNDSSDNVVLRKLLRGPRYFDSESRHWETCYNCGEEGHLIVNCKMERRQKPCFVCGMFGHKSNQCTQGRDCFICKRRGHMARYCPDKNKNIPQDSELCLRCGDFGHDMTSCRYDYAPDDLKEIQCYICKSFGHLCCVDYIDTGPREVSCYNCGQPGHTGAGCAKQRGETSTIRSPTLCYICGEEGHIARRCTQKAKSASKPRTPTQKFTKGGRDYVGSTSVPNDFGKGHKRKTTQYEGRKAMPVVKSKIKGGWIVDDPGDLPYGKRKANGWMSPTAPAQQGQKFSTKVSGAHYSGYQPSFRKHNPFPGTSSSPVSMGPYNPFPGTSSSPVSMGPYNPFPGTSNSPVSMGPYKPTFSASRFGSPNGYFRRN